MSIEDSVDAMVWGLEYYIKKSQEWQITAANNGIDNKQNNKN